MDFEIWALLIGPSSTRMAQTVAPQARQFGLSKFEVLGLKQRDKKRERDFEMLQHFGARARVVLL